MPHVDQSELEIAVSMTHIGGRVASILCIGKDQPSNMQSRPSGCCYSNLKLNSLETKAIQQLVVHKYVAIPHIIQMSNTVSVVHK